MRERNEFNPPAKLREHRSLLQPLAILAERKEIHRVFAGQGA